MAITRYMEVGIESAFGTKSTKIIPYLGNTSKPDINRNPLTDEHVSSYFIGDAKGGALECKASTELKVRADEIGDFLFALFGKVTTVDNGDGSYTHTFEFDDLKSLSLGLGENGILWEYLGVLVNKADFTFETKSYVNASFETIFREIKIGTFVEPTLDEKSAFSFWESYVEIDDVKIPVRKAEISIDRSVDDDDYVLDDFMLYGATVAGMGDVSGELVFREQNLDELRTAVFGSSTATSIPATNPLNRQKIEIIASLTEDSVIKSIKFEAPVSIYEEASWEITGRDRADRTVPFKIIGTDFTCELTNTVVSYPRP